MRPCTYQSCYAAFLAAIRMAPADATPQIAESFRASFNDAFQNLWTRAQWPFAVRTANLTIQTDSTKITNQSRLAAGVFCADIVRLFERDPRTFENQTPLKFSEQSDGYSIYLADAERCREHGVWAVCRMWTPEWDGEQWQTGTSYVAGDTVQYAGEFFSKIYGAGLSFGAGSSGLALGDVEYPPDNSDTSEWLWTAVPHDWRRALVARALADYLTYSQTDDRLAAVAANRATSLEEDLLEDLVKHRAQNPLYALL
ncbi:MAG: hypothetical protein LBR07_05250 [Puniceicoccales bacterium]|jgi:hypothetical protein|nr:hypothetical protein [Puniceicoccales bacterium]